MFVLTKLKDVIRLPPADFDNDFEVVVTTQINIKYANKVVAGVGLCILLWDVVSYGDQCIFPGDGAAFVEVQFHYVVFRPFVGEVLTGKVRSASPAGIQIELEFFDNILVPADAIPTPNQFDREGRVWLWNFQGHSLPIEQGCAIRVRVVAEAFQEVGPQSAATEAPANQPQPTQQKAGPGTDSTGAVETNEVFKQAPYTITCTINDDGLGPLEWWRVEDDSPAAD